jgi:hypothetical protein
MYCRGPLCTLDCQHRVGADQPDPLGLLRLGPICIELVRRVLGQRGLSRNLGILFCDKTSALRAFTDAVAHSRAAHADRTDAGHDLALWQMAVAHQPLAAMIGRLAGVPTEQGRDLCFDSLRQ